MRIRIFALSFLSLAFAKSPPQQLPAVEVYGSSVAQKQLDELRSRVAAQDQAKVLADLQQYDSYNRKATNAASQVRDYHEKVAQLIKNGNNAAAASLLNEPRYRTLLADVNVAVKRLAPPEAKYIPTVTAPPTDPQKLLAYIDRFEAQFSRADAAISNKVGQLKYDAYMRKIFDAEKRGDVKILSVRTGNEANDHHKFLMNRSKTYGDNVRPYTDNSSKEPVLTIEDTKGVLEVVGIKDVDSAKIKGGQLDPGEKITLGNYLTTPPDDRATNSRVYDEQGAAREDTASRNKKDLGEDQLFVKGKLKPGSVVQIGPVGPQPDSPDYYGQGSDIQIVRQGRPEEILRAYEQKPDAHDDIEKLLALSERDRKSGRSPDKFPPLSDAEKVALKNLPGELKKKYGIDLTGKASNDIDIIRYAVGQRSRQTNLLDVSRLITDYVKEKDPQRAANLKLAAQGLIEDLDVSAKRNLQSFPDGPAHTEAENQVRDVDVLKKQLTRYAQERGDSVPTFRAPEQRKLSSAPNTSEFENTKANTRVNSATQLAILAFKVARGEELDSLDKAGLLAVGIAEANILLTAQLIKSDKNFARQLAAATGIAGKTLGGLLAGVGLYQGSKDALGEIKKIKSKELLEAFATLSPSKFSEAFVDVDKEKLIVGSTVAVTSGATLVSLFTGGAGAAALIAETGGAALLLYGGYKGSEALRAHLIQTELKEQDAIKKRIGELAVDAHNATLKRNDEYIRKPIDASAADVSSACDIALDISKFMELVNDDEIKGAAGRECNLKARIALKNFQNNTAGCRETPSRICPSGVDACTAGANATKEFREKGAVTSDGTLLRVGALSNFAICQNQAANWAMTLQNSLYSTKNENSFARIAASVDPANKNLGQLGTRFTALIGRSTASRVNDNFDAYTKENGHLIGNLKDHIVNGNDTKSYCSGAFDIAEALYVRSLRLLNRCSELAAQLKAELRTDNKIQTANGEQIVDEVDYVKKLFAKSGLNEQGFKLPNKANLKGKASAATTNTVTEEHKK